MNITKMIYFSKSIKKLMENLTMLIIATNSAFIVTLIIFGNITVHQVVLRSVSVFMFFMFIFVAIFVPRRWLRNNRKYRYFLLSLYRRYPEVFYIRAIIGG